MRGETCPANRYTSHSRHFNPLPSYEGRRRKRSHERWLDQQFQSTPLMRGETARWRQVPWTYCHFNPLPSYEGRPYPELVNVNNVDFNPLPSCEGRPCPYPAYIVPNPFQSPPLMRGETRGDVRIFDNLPISIHSPHTRGDTAYRLRPQI